MPVRLPTRRTKDLILRLDLGTATLLARAAARENVDAEVIVERIIDHYYSPDGRTKGERQRAKAEQKAADLKAHHKSLGLSQVPDNEDEVLRLSRLANEA